MNTKYLVELSDEQQQHLEQLTLSGRIPARQMKRAQILLKSDQHWSYEQIAEAFDVSAVTIAKVRKAYVKQGLEVALQCKKPAREYEHVLDGEGEAHLIALACSEPPTGRERWSLRLLQQRFVKLGYTDNAHPAGLEKNELKPWLKEEGVSRCRPTPPLCVKW